MLGKTGIFLLIAGSLAGSAWAQDVMLTQVAGAVRVSGKAGARAAVPFLKVYEGDKLTLGENARVQMVYLAVGRQEIWKGSGEVVVGGKEGRSPSLKAQASQLPPLILKQLTKTPAVGQQGKTGMVMVRGLDDLEALDQLEKDYADFRAAAAPDDVTPEVFLLSGLLEYQDYDRAKKVLADLKEKQRTQPAYQPVVEHFERLIDAASTPPRSRP
ncbi:MAG TPA: hypothetical protein VK886_02200 [Vicinamibacterales bacterium]|nr:hypothetical protein [Vicinamibacterales bacterium]